MQAASTQNIAELAGPGGGLLPRLRAWFERGTTMYAAVLRHDGAAEDVRVVDTSVRNGGVDRRGGTMQAGVPAPEQGAQRPTAVLLPFPIHGEALMVRLAEQLRARIARSGVNRDSFVLTMWRRRYVRLIIDGAAQLEFCPETDIYRLVIGTERDIRIIVETTDFDSVVRFIAQYVTDRLSGELTGEVAS